MVDVHIFIVGNKCPDFVVVFFYRIVALKFQIEEYQNEVKEKKASLARIRPMFDQFVGWAKEFDNCTLEQKKMIISMLVRRIELCKDYEVNIELNMDYKQFCKDWEALNPENPESEEPDSSAIA